MKALLLENGKVQLRDVQKPSPGQDEALIEVLKAGICNTDLELIKGYMGFSGILGHEFVGRVVEAPENNWGGKRVVGEINLPCGICDLCLRGEPRHCLSRDVLGIAGKNGAFAEYMTLPLKNLHAVPDNVTETEAVFVEPLAAACEILEQVNVDGEMAVAVLGDGKLGLLIAQVMRLKTPHVDCYGKYDKKLRLLAGRGIQTFKSQEKTKKTYDLVIEATGSPSGIQQALTLVRPKGRIVLKSTVPAESSIEMAKVVVDEIMLIGSRCGPFDRAIHFLEQKLICVKELVDREFRLERGSEALAFAEEPEIIKVLLVP